ncbi:MAG: cell wall metabolism sensor histidine kinase WalK [Oscillospiraceae bacterium]|nr:cell wall metabolism sensor histidine kinase WalK [Oscillospiraceae bacterium]
MKLMLIMVLLIVSLMTVVGSFLINSVVTFYLDEFYEQMGSKFMDDQDFVDALRIAGEEETSGAQAIQDVLEANVGSLGVDSHARNYYILNGVTGAYLAGSNDELGASLEPTPNLYRALQGEVGSQSNVAVDFMDFAVPIERGGNRYIIYILDSRETVTALNDQLFFIILESLVFGLIISILLSFLLSKTMIAPIEMLTVGAERVAAGDFSHKIDVASRDEIGVLTNTFNNMASQLQTTLQEVENERNKLDTLFLHMTDGVVAFDPSGAVIHVNPAAQGMLGRRVGGADSYGALFGEIAPLSRLLALRQPGYLEEEMQVDDRSLELLLAPFSGENQGGVMVVIHDVTEQRKTEEERKEFVANVSHELRTPLTNIRSYAETLAGDGGDLPPEMRKNFFDVILNESDRMTHIVQDLLTLSRFDSGKNELKLTCFSFEKMVKDVYHAVLLEAGRHGHALTLDLEPGLPELTADRERVTQVLMNIISNSIKYTPDGGRIQMSAGVTANGRKVWLEVADNGIGIPKKDRNRIFERFYRVDKARSRESGGTGLGLSIAREIILQHKGTIGIVDTEEPGLTVRMTLWIEGPAHE